MLMVNDHQNCNCYDCLERTAITDNIEGPNIGDFIRSNREVIIYQSPGGKVYRKAKPNSYIGSVAGINQKRNWIFLTVPKGNAIPYTKDLSFRKPDPTKHLTEDQKKDVIYSALKNVPVAMGANPIALAEDIKDGGKKVIEFVGSFKWLIMAILLVVLIALFLRIKG